MNRLTVDRLTSIGAVEAGDNPESKIMFWKRKTTEPVQGQVEKGVSVAEPFDTDTLSDEAKAYVSELETKLAAMSAEEIPDALPEDLPDVVAKRIEDDADTIEKERVEKDALMKRVTALEDGIATDKAEARAEELAPLLGEIDVVAPVLKALDAAAPEAFGKLDAMFDTLIVKDITAPLFKELGDSSSNGSAVDQIAVFATEIRKNSPDTSLVDAKAQAWRDHPELKTLAREEGN